jgi:hypothetical protein
MPVYTASMVSVIDFLKSGKLLSCWKGVVNAGRSKHSASHFRIDSSVLLGDVELGGTEARFCAASRMPRATSEKASSRFFH